MGNIIGIEQADFGIASKLETHHIIWIISTSVPRVYPCIGNVFPEFSLAPVVIVVTTLKKCFENYFVIFIDIIIYMLALAV
jgi:hypothetical protein